MKKNTLLCIALTFLMIPELVACSTQQAAPSSTPTSVSTAAPTSVDTKSTPTPSKTPVADANPYEAFELVTKDDAVVKFDHIPLRVLSANPNAGEELMALGLGEKIIATSYNNAKVAEEYREEYESKPSLTSEGQPSLEVVLELNPDFIYGRSSAFGDKGIATHDTLTQNGIMSLSSIEGYKTGADVQDVYQDFYNLGKIFQVEEKAQEIVDGMKSRITAIEAKVKGVDPFKVFNFDAEMEGGAYTPGNNFTSKLIRRAGGVNVFENLEKTWNVVNWEAVVEADPDIIIINDYSGTPLEEKIQQLKTNPALSGLKAIKEENFLIITLPEVFASSRIADTVEKFAEAFHPDLFVE